MKKIDKFYESLMGKEIYPITIGEEDNPGYIVTIGDLLDNGGKNEFFRTIRKTKSGISVSRNVYYNLIYDRHDRTYEANCYTDISGWKEGLKRTTKVFVGFTF